MTKKNEGWEPCAEGCLGVILANQDRDVPDGWVEVERCDDCARWRTDNGAALAVSDGARWYDRKADQMGPRLLEDTSSWLLARKEHAGTDLAIIVPRGRAREFGLDAPDDGAFAAVLAERGYPGTAGAAGTVTVPAVRKALVAAESLVKLLGNAAESALRHSEEHARGDVGHSLWLHREGKLEGLQCVAQTIEDYLECLDEELNGEA